MTPRHKRYTVVTVILRDGITKALLLNERYHSNDTPLQVALAVVDAYFSRHCNSRLPEKIEVYFRSDQRSPWVIKIAKIDDKYTATKVIIGCQHSSAAENHHYDLEEGDERVGLAHADALMLLEQNTEFPKYETTAL